ncbi:MAG: bifunctional hydroxymethylpyrimidine kinase/phosphomethylpyrimidine kinase [Terriglobia bacterium]
MAKALTIAGSDSSGGAGIQADLKTFAAFGVYGCSVITAITAQNTKGVTAVHALPPGIVQEQLEAVLSDIEPDVIKLGMLANASIIHAISQVLRRYPKKPLILDPVMSAKSGDCLLEPEALRSLQNELFPLATLVTPNIPEAEILIEQTIASEEDMAEAARRIFKLGVHAVLVKGGHVGQFQEPAGAKRDEIVDVYWDGKAIHKISGPRIDTPHTHGTGCTLSSAIAAGLAFGHPLLAAIQQARQYLTGALQNAYAVGSGKSPVDHFHQWRKKED